MKAHTGGGHRLSILMPIFNEQETVARIVQRILQTTFPIPIELIIVDDHSTDRTFAILKRLGHAPEGMLLKVIRNRVNKGKGACIRQALMHATGTLVVVQDGDLEYDPTDIPALLRPMLAQEAAVVYGSRFLRWRWPAGMSWPNYVANRTLTWLTNRLYGVRLTDMETCYKLLPRDLLRYLRVRADRFEFEPEITAKLARSGVSIVEWPISYHGRTRREGKKIKASDFLIALWVLLRYRVYRSVRFGRAHLTDGLPSVLAHLQHRAVRYQGNELAAMTHAKNYYRSIFEQFRPFLGPRLIEVGAGIGTFSKVLLRMDGISELTLVEPSANLVSRLRRRFGVERRVRICERLEDLQRRAHHADACVAVNVLEHASDDRGMLTSIYQLLRSEGVCLLFVPALPWLFGSLDRVFGHQRRYTARSLRKVLASAGFRRIRIRYFNFPGIMTWFLVSRILRQRRLHAWSVRLYDRYVIPLIAPIERRWAPPIGQSLVAIAHKP